MPRPPASLTAAVSSGVLAEPIGAWTIGRSMPSSAHSGVASVTGNLRSERGQLFAGQSRQAHAVHLRARSPAKSRPVTTDARWITASIVGVGTERCRARSVRKTSE